MIARSRRGTFLVLGLAAALLGSLLLAPSASASVRCSHTDPPAGELRVTPFSDPELDLDFADGTVRRDGRRILVLEVLDREVKCAGPPATVANTSTIVFLQSGLAFNTLDLSGGLPAPRIEFRSDLGALGYGIVIGTPGPDRWTVAGTRSAVELAVDPATPGVAQVSWDGLGINVPGIQTGKGNDTVDASAIRRRHAVTVINGGEGNDSLLGSPLREGIEGGPGRDLLEGGGGNDEIDGRDHDPDRIDCGAGGHDKAQPGRGDSVKGCETVERPGHRGPIPKPPWLN